MMLHDSETFRGSVRREEYAAMMYCNDDRTPRRVLFYESDECTLGKS